LSIFLSPILDVPPLFAFPPQDQTTISLGRYTGATLLSQPANTTASEHRDQLVNQLMVCTGLTAAMPIAAFLRRDLPLFFENFEAFKGGPQASVAASPAEFVSLPAAALPNVAPAIAPPADMALAGAVELMPTPTMGVIKVSPPKITRQCI
jgi:hypothetical protein